MGPGKIIHRLSVPCVFQAELQQRLDAEIPRNLLDMRHRLDKDGNRYGKIINYK
jgi:hypothetical protein